jgi:hypothetical protein
MANKFCGGQSRFIHNFDLFEMDDKAKKQKSEDLLVDLESLVDTLKKRHKEGKQIDSKQIIQSVDDVLVPFSREVEFHELKNKYRWWPLTNIKWIHVPGGSYTHCNEVFAVSFEVADSPIVGTLRAQFRHRCGHNGFHVVNEVTVEKAPDRDISWHRLSSVALVRTYKQQLCPALHAIISEHSTKKDVLNSERLKHAIEYCKFNDE